MINKEGQVSRKMVKEARIAICLHFGCTHLEKIKPLKFGILGFRKYPKCSKHKLPLVFVDEFVENFLNAINACLFDMSSLPPEDLTSLIKTHAPKNLKAFVNGWMYCNPIGRGAQIVSNYMDGLSRGYMKLLSRKQRKSLQNEKHSKIRYHMLRSGLEMIAREYATFLQGLREKSEVFHDPRELRPLSDEVRKLLKTWLRGHLKKIHVVSGKYKSESLKKEETLPLLKEKYDKILHAGTCSLLLGKSPAVVTKGVSPFELFSAYHEFLKAGLCRELKREDAKSLLEESKDTERALGVDFDNAMQNEFQTEIPEKKVVNNKEDVNISTIKTINSGNEQKLTKNTHTSFPLNTSNFRKRVMKEMRRLIPLLEATNNQKELILEKAEDILDQHISRAIKNDITIHKDENPLTNAGAIVYAVLVSNENMPKVSGMKMSKMIGASQNEVSKLYNSWYKDLAQKIEFDLTAARLGRSRNIILLYLFERLIGTENDISELVSRLNKFDTSELVFSLKEIIINTNAQTLEEHNLLAELTEREIKIYQNMVTHYPDFFNKYFSDLVNIIKLLIISIKTHNIIGADFFVLNFVKFFMNIGIDLFLKEDSLRGTIRGIFNSLDKTKYLIPNRYGSGKVRTKDIYTKVIGSRIKLYIMKYIYSGEYFDKEEGIAKCPECLNEGFIVNTSFPRLRSKEFHHLDEETKAAEYNSAYFHSLFTKDRGNPYFLLDLIKEMREEKVVLKCACHHIMAERSRFNYFKKLVNWENIPKEFPYKDVFHLPPEIIHALAWICVNNIPQHLLVPSKRGLETDKFYINQRGKRVKSEIIYFLKKRYILDFIYGGVCPVCGEFNTRNHLPVFEFNHTHELSKLSQKERERYKKVKKKASDIVKDHSCSEAVRELERQQGGYLCSNCHRVIHTDINNVYEDQDISKLALKDYRNTLSKHKQNLVRINELIGDPLELNVYVTRDFVNFIFALYEISEKNGVVTPNDLVNRQRGRTAVNSFFRIRKNVLVKYGELITGSDGSPIEYRMNNEGKRIVRLMKYFERYYRDYERHQ